MSSFKDEISCVKLLQKKLFLGCGENVSKPSSKTLLRSSFPCALKPLFSFAWALKPRSSFSKNKERGTRFLKGMMNNFFILFFFTSFLILLFLSLSLSISSREPGFNLVLPYTQTSVSTSTMYQSTHVEPRLYAVLKSEFNQLPIFIEKFSPLQGFEPGTSLVPSRYATNWAILAWMCTVSSILLLLLLLGLDRVFISFRMLIFFYKQSFNRNRNIYDA